MGFISEIFGYVLNFLYQWLNNYGLALILFTVLLRLLLLPISIKQQKTMKKSAKLQEKTKILQVKYKNDPERLNKETMQLYKDEKMSPFSGCLSGILQIIIVLAVFWLVSQPLTYMVRVNNNEELKTIVEEYKSELNQNSGKKSAYIEIGVISKIEEDYNQIIKDIENYDEYVERTNKEIKEAEDKKKEEAKKEENEDNKEKTEEVKENTENTENKEEDKEEIKLKVLTKEELEKRKENLEKLRINMEFLTLDLSMVLTQNLTNWKVYVIPVLYVITSFISIRIATNAQKKALTGNAKTKNENENGEDDKEKKDSQDELMESMGQMNNTMNYMMPIMSISIAAIAPLGLALYWLVSNILMIFERLIIDKLIKTKGDGEDE